MAGHPRICSLLLLFATLAVGAPRGAVSAPLRVVFTAETRGNLEPCDCPGLPLGGLARRVGFMEHVVKGASGHQPSPEPGRIAVDASAEDFPAMPLRKALPLLLRLDVGGFLPEGEVPLANRPGVLQRYVSLIVRGLENSGVDAGVLDYRMRAYLEDLAPTPFGRLASRFMEADPPSAARLFDWDGSTVALLALEESLPDSIIIAAAAAARMATGPDGYLFILGRADAFSGRRLARLTQADLVLLSRGARSQRPLVEGRSILAACGAHGREVGDLLLDKARSGEHIRLHTNASVNPSVRIAPETRGMESTQLDPIHAPGGRLRVIEWILHPMDEAVPENRTIATEVRRLVVEAGLVQGHIQPPTRE